MTEQNKTGDTEIFEKYESDVRTYCRAFPSVFKRAKGAGLFDEQGREYIDFFAGAGALNYGHNPDFIKRHLINFFEEDSISHSLDFYTATKRDFLQNFVDIILKPRNLDYKVQFCGPTGANTVEAALKLARLATGRKNICYFTGGWHGMTLGCLSILGNKDNRRTAGVPITFTNVLPYCEGPSSLSNSAEYLESLLTDPNSGLDTPAAVILETVQAEGGIYVADIEWLKQIREICTRHGVLMIVDEVQVGCGRTGPFFSFERAGIKPDIICLAKSIGGYGLPMSLLLMNPSVDVWKPGDHTGTFRGNQAAILCGSIALKEMWRTPAFQSDIVRKGELIKKILTDSVLQKNKNIRLRGLGMILGVDLMEAGGEKIAKQVSRKCYDAGLIIERVGRNDSVLKILPPLTIEDDLLIKGCNILCDTILKEVSGS